MSDLISRAELFNRLATVQTLEEAYAVIQDMPVQQTLYGYDVKHLAYIAAVMAKEGVTAEDAVRTFDDLTRVANAIDEEYMKAIRQAMKVSIGESDG